MSSGPSSPNNFLGANRSISSSLLLLFFNTLGVASLLSA